MPRIAFIDFESSGLNMNWSYPIEIGFALSTGEGPYACLIAPAEGWWYWDPEAEEIHGITRARIEVDGWPPSDVVTWLRQHIDDVPLYADAVEDRIWLDRLLEATGTSWNPALYSANGLINATALKRGKDPATLRREVAARRHGPQHRAGPDAAFLRDVYRAACRG